MFRTESRAKGASAIGAHPGERGPFGTWPDNDQDDEAATDTH